MTDMAKMFAMQSARRMAGQVADQDAAISTLVETIQTLRQQKADLQVELDQYRMHFGAEKTLRLEAMRLLDEAYGADGNPLRQTAYADDEEFRIPTGDRKGEVVTQADHIYLTKCAEIFKEHFAGVHKHFRSWKGFLHELISY